MGALSVAPMSESEARACVAQISSGIDSVRTHILELHERSGWVALGYKNWRACVSAEFPNSERELYRELTTAKVERVLTNLSKTPVHITESHARELARLDPKDQPKAWAEAVKTAPDGVVTAKHVAAIVTARLPEPKPKRVQPAPETEQRNADVANDCADALGVECVAAPKPAKWECAECGIMWPADVTVCAECDAPSGVTVAAEAEDDVAVADADTEASALFDHICSILKKLQGQDLRPIEVVLDQLLGRVRKDSKRAAHA